MWKNKSHIFEESERESLLPDKMSGENSPRVGRCSALKAEFKLRNLDLNYYMREAFYLSQWHWPPVLFIVYRVVVSAYTLAWLLYTCSVTGVLVINGQAHYWPVWLTSWTYLLLTIHLLLSAVITILHTVEEKQSCCNGHRIKRKLVTSEDAASGVETSGAETSGGMGESYGLSGQVEIQIPVSLPWYMKLNWLIYNMVATFALVVTVVYFSALYPLLSKMFGEIGPSVIDINLHAINSVIIVLELLINGIPMRILHMLYPLIYGIVYVIFSAIYWAVDHRNVLYPGVLDWNKPVTTIIALLVVGFVLVPVLHFLLFLGYKLRVYIYNKIYSE